MSLFNLFKKSEWSKLKKFDSSVQQDIASLVALDALMKSGIRNAIDRFTKLFNSTSDQKNKALCSQLVKQEFVNELEIALLSTGVGKVLPEISWNKVQPQNVIEYVGSLVMNEFRCGEEGAGVINDLDITKSGFSSTSNEARAQFLILLSNAAGMKDTVSLKLFDIEHFNEFWFELKNLIFVSLQKNVAAEAKGLTSLVRERFEMLPKSSQEGLLVIAAALDSSQDKNNNNSFNKSAESSFDAEKYKLEHPYLFIPFPKINKLSKDIFKKALDDFIALGFDEYEHRRVAGLKDEVPKELFFMAKCFDLQVFIYCAIVAVILNKEPKFIRSGVWKAITKEFEKTNIMQFGLMAGFRLNGRINIEAIDPDNKSSNIGPEIALMTLIRGSSKEFLKSSGDSISRLKVLTQGTVAFSGLLSHPKYSTSLLEFTNLILEKIDQETTEFIKGELIFDQKDLT